MPSRLERAATTLRILCRQAESAWTAPRNTTCAPATTNASHFSTEQHAPGSPSATSRNAGTDPDATVARTSSRATLGWTSRRRVRTVETNDSIARGEARRSSAPPHRHSQGNDSETKRIESTVRWNVPRAHLPIGGHWDSRSISSHALRTDPRRRSTQSTPSHITNAHTQARPHADACMKTTIPRPHRGHWSCRTHPINDKSIRREEQLRKTSRRCSTKTARQRTQDAPTRGQR